MLRLIVALVSVLGIGCATSVKLNKKSDYLISTNHLLKGESNQALEKLPETEKKGFIALTEQTWLGLVAGEPLPSKALVKMGRKLPTKETVIVSDEISHYFYQKTPEGYFPAEHEVIYFHILSSMVFLRGGDLESAEVEARKAAFYLQDDFVSSSGGFDSAHLRVWLAAIWASLGQWDKAQVDLRNAASISDDFDWAGVLAKLKKSPANLSLVLQGVGPEPEFKPSGVDEHLTGKGSIEFKEPKLAKLIQVLPKNVANLPVQKSRIDEYERHINRNDRIRDVLEQSDYMMKSSVVHTGGAIAKASGIAAAGTMIATGLALGLGIFGVSLYAASQSNDSSGEIVGLGFALGYGAFEIFRSGGKKLYKSVNSSVDDATEKALDLSTTYRYVRYMPSKVFLLWGNKPHKISAEVEKADGVRILSLEPFLNVKSQNTKVNFYYSPN